MNRLISRTSYILGQYFEVRQRFVREEAWDDHVSGRFIPCEMIEEKIIRKLLTQIFNSRRRHCFGTL